ncbi:MAG: stress response translation initiation inhibitor YciH [Alteromonadaceae bacterium]|nr:MAG: stress response translation initiation inhibitor YciH [Alteromonadaceae bacterium]
MTPRNNNNDNSSSRLVYSTENGRIKLPKGTNKPKAPASDGIIRLLRETKGRNGKGVTIVTGFELDDKALKILAKKLKQLCGTGGTAKDGIIEIQGDQRDKLLDHLKAQGHQVKLAGG